MIHEYAVDPGILRDWQTFRHLADGFGYHAGRIIAKYPNHWARLVYKAVEGLDDNTKKKTETWLQDRASNAMAQPRSSAIPYRLPIWFENAVAENARFPFHAIISDRPATANPPVLKYTDIDGAEALWQVGRQRYVSRTVNDITRCVAPLLEHATLIRIIDPYFKGDPDQINILLGSLSKCVQAGKSIVTSIEIHVDGVEISPPVEQHILSALRPRWPNALVDPLIVRWRRGHLHNRMILTNLGGISFGDTIRVDATRPDQLTLLEDTIRTKWWDHHRADQHAAQICQPGEIL